MKKIVIFAFRGEPLCFVHGLLNAMDLHEKGLGGHLVIEGETTKLLADMISPSNFLHPFYKDAKSRGIIDGVCRACSIKMGTIEIAEKEGLNLLSDMKGHPSMGAYISKGFDVVVL